MNRIILFALVAVLALGCVLGAYILTLPRDTKAGGLGNNLEKTCGPAANQPVKTVSENKTPEQIAEAEYLGAESAADRIELIRKAAAMPGAKSSMPLLRKAIVSDPDERVQVEAFNQSVELAGKESMGTQVEVIRTGINAPRDGVCHQALIAARKHPSPELVADLIKIADGKAEYRFAAVRALAFTEDPRAKAKVLEVASRTDGNKSERVDAVALLIQTKDPNAQELLHQLSGSSDEELRKVALEVINALQTQ